MQISSRPVSLSLSARPSDSGGKGMVLSQSERILLKEVKKTKINQLIQGEEDLEGDAKERERQPLV